MIYPVGRRRLLAGAAASLCFAGIAGCTSQRVTEEARLSLARIDARMDRVTRITVCTRPFRPAGPRLEAEKFGAKTVVHNYGHGGSGWSLSWGSGAIAVEKAMATGERDLAVIGCGALGLTSALLLQRAGARVTIYAKDLPPNVRSSNASGVWTPDSRICFEENATPAFKKQWEFMCRRSFDTYQSLLGLAGDPVEFIDSYYVSDHPPGPRRTEEPADGRPAFASLQRELVPDLVSRGPLFAPGSHNLGPRYLRANSLLMFNISSYSRLLLDDFRNNGGRIEITEFKSPSDLARLAQNTIVNCSGYGARALFGDTTLVPVRGQLARGIPQPEIGFGLYYKGVSFVPRRDGLVFQVVGDSDYYGFGDDTTEPDRDEAERAVATIAGLYTA
jgi:glycine/D-amino acid oxidase-like deaminating enzyme